ncbi:MAG: 2-oxoacid:acceptor oxidoreductase subunit alpha [Dehalococcoidia bacterium]|nr:2-oxoacid:acceptor oxidoreductase subunit alpha [Dehalococcoidia bacterium]
MATDINFLVGGEAGQGVQSVGFILGKTLARGGYHVFADQDYESRIRGGHNFFRVRASDAEVRALRDSIEVLVALNQETVELHRNRVVNGGLILTDEGRTEKGVIDGNVFGVPLDQIAMESAGNRLMSNTVAVGAALALVDYDLAALERVVYENFHGGDIGDANIRAAAAGYRFARDNFKGQMNFLVRPVGEVSKMFLNGHEAVSLGALAAGCKFMAAYPMTPASSILEYIAAKGKDLGVVVVQPEDEIAAVNMTVGAAFAGARSMTATSGSGFALMVEAVGLAGITETPIVIVNGQRPGPAVGLPTRTEQGDLAFVIHTSPGEFPRAVLAPATVEDCFWLTVKAFNLAEMYQIPVIILTDQYIASSYATVDKFDLSRVMINRGELLTGAEAASDYKRHLITASGVSPRAIPMEGEAIVATDSDEHDEEGHLIEDAATRKAMVSKRLRKREGLVRDMGPPRVSGPENADVMLVGWGSTYGAIMEAAGLLENEGVTVSVLHMNEIWPFPSETVAPFLGRARKTLVVENNATGQLARLIRAETGIKLSGGINKFDGRPFSALEIARQVKKEVAA